MHIDSFRRLPPATAADVSELVRRLAEHPPGRRIDWSDSWSEEDLQEFTAAALDRQETEEGEHSA